LGGNMLLHDRDPNGGGRTSRASNVSALSRTSGKSAHAAANPDMRGVSSMLRTSTETNVGGFDDLSAIGNMHRLPQRRGAPSRLSTASSMSNNSSRASRHYRAYPSSSSAARYSMGGGHNMPQYVPDTLSPTMVNIPGSSPMVPTPLRERDAYRSQSMTNSIQPPYRLSSNRSLNNLGPASRPYSPHHYQNRYGAGPRPHNSNYRSASPALSDNTGLSGRRSHGYDYYGQSYGGQAHAYANRGRPSYNQVSLRHGGQGQPYDPSVPTMHKVGKRRVQLCATGSVQEHDERMDRIQSEHRDHSRNHSGDLSRHPSREPSMDCRRYPEETPPLPQQNKYRSIAVQQARLMGTSVEGSVSSGSTNLRSDSDPPSSDMASPPTPVHGASMGVLHSRDGTVVVGPLSSNNALIITQEYSASPAYYDYSEPYEDDQVAKPQPVPHPIGILNRIKTTSIDERVPAEATPKSDSFLGQKAQPMSVAVVPSEVLNIAELPASPVARRITRDLILKGLEPVSTADDIESCTKSPNHQGDLESTHSDGLPVATPSAPDGADEASLHPEKRMENRHSIMSQTGSSILDSSTLNFAVRHSIPMATGGGFRNDPVPASDKDANLRTSPERSTEDGMTDVLAGYQRSDSKSVADVTRGELTCQKEECLAAPLKTSTEKDLRPLPLVTGSKSNHVQKSSDGQSFKSCADLPETTPDLSSSETVPEEKKKDEEGESSKSGTDDLPLREPCPKESDASPSMTAKPVSPDRAGPVLLSRLATSNLGTMVLKQNRAKSEVPLSRPPTAMLRKQPPPVPRRESSFSIVAHKLRTSSKPSLKHASVSSSSSTLSTTHLPLMVPPRESSTSKEAQRVHAAVSFLMRPLPSRLTKGRKRFEEVDTPNPDETDQSASESRDTQSTLDSKMVMGSSPQVFQTSKSPEKVSVKPNGVPPLKTRIISFDTPGNSSQNEVDASSPNQAAHQHSLSSPSPIMPEPSSVYSPQEDSSRFRTKSSPARVSAPTEVNCRDSSQTTTHLDWHRWVSPTSGSVPQQVPVRPLSGSGSHLHAMPPLAKIQEDTTTDLRLSAYRYPGPSRYLPDLKEESHEDSSLNTSASNLMNSSFRFPFGPSSVLRASGDDPVSFSRRSSLASHRCSGLGSGVGSALGHAHGLPSMRFSRMNLFDGLTEELGLRYSKSMEEVANVSQRLSKGSPPRPASAGDVSDLRRTSLTELDDLERSRGSMQPTTVISLFAMRHARSPELMAEIDRLTIPDVGPLTQRLSEYFPSLREYYKLGEATPEFPAEEEIERHAIEEIYEIHPTQKRSSARLRPIRGSSHMVLIEDDLYEELTGKEQETESRGGQGNGVVGDCGASELDAKTKQIEESNQATNTHTAGKLEILASAVLRPRSHTVGPEEFPTDTRPWNSDKNYPWATSTNPAIDISLPPSSTARRSPHPGPSHLRNRISDTSTTSSFSTAQTATASPFGSAPDSNSHARQHRFSALSRNGDQPHAVGERYPTSALSPPTAIFRDHLSASDTSDDEHYDTTRKTRLSLRKRFSSTRKATLDSINNTTTRVSRGKSNTQPLASPESTKQSTTSILQDRAGEDQAFTTNRHTFREAEGMRPADYRKHRIIDRLKTWWHKGGNLIRQLSRSKHSTSSTSI
ncbi:hypothetical protein BDW02DRAFT_486083, partial [Decorospora gaudefroyi]